MGSNDEFGPDTESIRAWLSKRATYAKDARVVGAPRGGGLLVDPSPRPESPSSDLPDADETGRSVLAALGVQDPTPPPRTPSTRSVDGTDLGRSIVDALGEIQIPSTDDAPADAPEDAPQAPAARAPERRGGRPAVRHTPAPASRHQEGAVQGRVHLPPVTDTRDGPQVPHGRWTEPAENLGGSTDVEFAAKGGVRRALSLVLLASLAATGWAGYAAVQDPTPATTGLAGVLGFLVLVVWAVRAGCTTTQLTVRRGRLTIKRNGREDVVELSSPYTPVAIVGEPGDRRWTVLIERPGQPLVIVTRSWVDPEGFTRVLYRLRPGLRPDYADPSQ